MYIADPDFPHVVLGFTYRGCKITIDKGECNGQLTYAAWVDYEFGDVIGSAVAVPFAFGRAEAMRKAKRWVDARLG